MNENLLLKEIFRLVVTTVFYTVAVGLLLFGARQTSFLLLMFSTLCFFALTMYILNYILNFLAPNVGAKVRHNGYIYFALWGIYYLLSIVATPIIIVIMLIRCVIIAVSGPSTGSRQENSIEPKLSSEGDPETTISDDMPL